MPRILLPLNRTRIINFRVTAQEYDLLRTACVTAGTNNLSEFARRAALDCASAHDGPSTAIAAQLSTLDRKLTNLGELLKSIKPK